MKPNVALLALDHLACVRPTVTSPCGYTHPTFSPPGTCSGLAQPGFDTPRVEAPTLSCARKATVRCCPRTVTAAKWNEFRERRRTSALLEEAQRRSALFLASLLAFQTGIAST